MTEFTTEPSSDLAAPYGGSERFELRGRLGAGGMGEVFEAWDCHRRRRVALKVLRRVDPLGLQLFKQEFRLLAGLSHPTLAQFHELLQEDGRWLITMDLIEGQDFLLFIRQDGGAVADTTGTAETVAASAVSSELAEQECTDETVLMPDGPEGVGFLTAAGMERLERVLPRLCRAVSVLHGFGSLHCDLKPSNVLVGEEGHVTLLDFGLATELRPVQGRQTTEVVSGTVPYMSPEQAAGKPLTEASDWYAVGVMLYEALVGQVPHRGPTSVVLAAKLKEDSVVPGEVAATTPPYLVELCNRLLRRCLDERAGWSEISAALRLDDEASPGERAVGSAAAGLVGREEHLRVLKAAFVRVREQPVVLHLSGRSGMGKSALLKSFLDGLSVGKATVLVGRCYERESVPFKAVDQVIDALSAHLLTRPDVEVAGLLPRHIRSVVQVFPVLDRVPAISGVVRKSPPPSDGRELRRQAFGALRELLGLLGEQGPLVVSIDDLQWGDMDSANLIGHLLRPPDPPAMLLLLSYRTENLCDSSILREVSGDADGQGAPAAVRLEVGPLGPDDSVRLSRSLLGERSDLEETARAVAAETAGIPFFIEELCRWAARPDGGPPDLAAAGSALDASIVSRAKVLGKRALRLLQAVALAGRPVVIETLAGVANLADPWPVLSALHAANLVRMADKNGVLVECYHDRIREAVVHSLSTMRAQELHLVLARTCEDDGRTAPDVVADHYFSAGHPELAVPLALYAANDAARAMAFGRAAALYRLCLARGEWEEERRRELLESLAEMLGFDGRGAEASDVYLEAGAQAPEQDRSRLKRMAAEQLLWSGHIDRAKELFDDTLSEWGLKIPASSSGAMVSFLMLRARVRLRGLDFKPRGEGDIPRETLDRLDTLHAVGTGLGLVEPLRAAAFQARSLLLALDVGEPERVLQAQATEAAYRAAFGGKGYRDSVSIVERCRALAQGSLSPKSRTVYHLAKAVCHFQQGQWGQCHADASMAEDIALAGCKGVAWELSTARIYRLSALMWMGRYADAESGLREMEAEAIERGDHHSANHYISGAVIPLGLLRDQPGAAREELEATQGRLPKRDAGLLHSYALRCLVLVALYGRDAETALRRADELARLTRDPAVGSIALVQFYTAECNAATALLAAREGDVSVHVKVARREARRLSRWSPDWAFALAVLVNAGIARLEGRADEAIAGYQRAEELFGRLQMELYRAAAAWRGALLQGDFARRQAEDALESLSRQGVANPQLLMAMVAPVESK